MPTPAAGHGKAQQAWPTLLGGPSGEPGVWRCLGMTHAPRLGTRLFGVRLEDDPDTALRQDIALRPPGQTNLAADSAGLPDLVARRVVIDRLALPDAGEQHDEAPDVFEGMLLMQVLARGAFFSAPERRTKRRTKRR